MSSNKKDNFSWGFEDTNTGGGKEPEVQEDDWFSSNSNDSFHGGEQDSEVDNDLDVWGSSTAGIKKNNKKKPKKKLIIIGVSIFIVLTIGATTIFKLVGKDKLPQEQTAVYELRNVNQDIQTANVENLGKYVTDSWLALEWDYLNDRKVRQDFFNRVMETVTFVYLHKDNTSKVNEVPINMEHIDWVKVTNDMRDFDFKKIQAMYADKGIKKTNYDYHNEMIDLFCSYVLSLEELPITSTKGVDLEVKGKQNKDKTYSWNLEDDSPIDKVLFSSEDFHTALDVFGGIATGDIGQLKTNPNWVSWNKTKESLEKQLEVEKKNLDKYNKIVRNSEGTVLHKDENGEVVAVINLDKGSVGTETEEEKEDDYKTIKAPVVDNPDLTIVTAIENELKVLKANEPLETYIERPMQENPEWKDWNRLSKADKENTKQPDKKIPKPLKKQANVRYTWIGAYYLQNEYMVGDKQVIVEPEEGDGSKEKPLGFGTPTITKMKASNGKYHDVRVTLTKMLTGQDAIDYATKFDERNRGFDLASELQLMVVEFKVENLEGKELILDSEFTLSDENGNIVPRTGNMYNFAERTKIKPHKTATMQDWFFATSLDSRYLVWGESFERKYPEQWYKVLSGDWEKQE